MADEVENKPKFILNKQKNDKPSQPKEEKEPSQEKKKVVVRRKPVVVAKTSEKTDNGKNPQVNNSNTSSITSSGLAFGLSILFITTIGSNPNSKAFFKTNFVCGIGPS